MSVRRTESPTASGSALSHLVPLDEFQRDNSRLFPSIESLRWFVRRHRDSLTGAGALIFIGRRWLIDTRLIGGAFEEIGRRQSSIAPAGAPRSIGAGAELR